MGATDDQARVKAKGPTFDSLCLGGAVCLAVFGVVVYWTEGVKPCLVGATSPSLYLYLGTALVILSLLLMVLRFVSRGFSFVFAMGLIGGLATLGLVIVHGATMVCPEAAFIVIRNVDGQRGIPASSPQIVRPEFVVEVDTVGLDLGVERWMMHRTVDKNAEATSTWKVEAFPKPSGDAIAGHPLTDSQREITLSGKPGQRFELMAVATRGSKTPRTPEDGVAASPPWRVRLEIPPGIAMTPTAAVKRPFDFYLGDVQTQRTEVRSLTVVANYDVRDLDMPTVELNWGDATGWEPVGADGPYATHPYTSPGPKEVRLRVRERGKVEFMEQRRTISVINPD